MNIVEIIKKKRDNKPLTSDEISFMVKGYTEGTITDYQFSAFLMACFIHTLNTEETTSLTNAMLFSGIVVDLSEINGIKIDKHSTGGVGDKTSIIIAPILASLGVYVPMISGRGLGHTGGTLDKLDSIPGFKTSLNLDDYKKVLKDTGAVLVGQTEDIAPADKKIYSLRDVTGTVESIPLITASIMSKKLAEGIDGLVLDVKTGTGAFMQTLDDSVKLAASLMNTAKRFNKSVIAFITDMNQPLGSYIGNYLEIYECVKILNGEIENDLSELSHYLAGGMIFLAGKAESIEGGYELSKAEVKSGKALSKFYEIAKAHGAESPENIIDLEKNPHKCSIEFELKAEVDGYIKFVNNYEIGMAGLELGAGRAKKEDIIDYGAGIVFYRKQGDEIKKGEVIAKLFCNDDLKIKRSLERLNKAFIVVNEKPESFKLIKEILQ